MQYTDDELTDSTFPDPRRSNADELILEWREKRARQIFDEAIEQLKAQQRREDKSGERRAENWIIRFSKIFYVEEL
jgi:hypothetical protein